MHLPYVNMFSTHLHYADKIPGPNAFPIHYLNKFNQTSTLIWSTIVCFCKLCVYVSVSKRNLFSCIKMDKGRVLCVFVPLCICVSINKLCVNNFSLIALPGNITGINSIIMGRNGLKAFMTTRVRNLLISILFFKFKIFFIHMIF